MKPMKNLVVIELNETPEEKVSGGLFIQKPRWAKPDNIGIALALGPDVLTVRVGEHYLINPYAVIDTNEKNIKLIRESDILCHLPISQ